MGLKERLFGKKTTDEAPDPLADLVLDKLKVGYLVDYDMQTWQITSHARYHFSGTDDPVQEWELTAAGEQRFLELADGAWSLSRNISIGDLAGNVRQHILDHEDPPERVVFDGAEYHLDASYAGQMVPDGSSTGQEVIRWEFLDAAEKTFVGIEQWSETEFAAAAGFVVEDYQFSHILPGVL
ncbi:MAG: DUF4178 domain-containing protein [Acidobacteria bacterium]|nr:DUF4178 domain-containing protein [Acidobacteriota bacterium]